jgi:predicted ATP-grasp superfamily ATP-dependent carboligase
VLHRLRGGARCGQLRRRGIATPNEVYGIAGLSLLKAEVSPFRERENEFFRELAGWIAESGAKEIAVVGGLDESLKSDDDAYKAVMISAFKAAQGLPGEPTLDEDRMIVGPVASLLNLFEMNGFPAYAVLACSNTERVDPRAATTAVRFLAGRCGFKADTAPLIKGAEVLEGEVKQIEDRDERPPSSVYS